MKDLNERNIDKIVDLISSSNQGNDPKASQLKTLLEICEELYPNSIDLINKIKSTIDSILMT